MATHYDDKTALLVVDLQNDFADPSGALYVEGGEEVVEAANLEVERARAAGALVAFTQDWHPPSTPHFERDGGIWPVHCVADTWGARFHPALRVEGPVVRKGTGGEDGYSGFSMRDSRTGERSDTELGALLEEQSITTVVVLGLALDYCVLATALDARAKGLDTIVELSATRAVERVPGDGDRAIESLRQAGVRLSA